MSAPLHLTFEQAKADLEAVVAEKGEDYVYERPEEEDQCVYFLDGRPSCIIGQVMARHGVTQEALGPANYSTAEDLRNWLAADDNAAHLLVAVQDSQDSGTPWGEALRRGLEAIHVDYPHFPGRLHDCPACEASCHCTEGSAECVYDGEHNGLAS